eukprot:c47155_g1_i1 orf=835-1185(+)
MGYKSMDSDTSLTGITPQNRIQESRTQHSRNNETILHRHKLFHVNYSNTPMLHSQVLKLRAEDLHFTKYALEPIQVPRERMQMFCLTVQTRAESARTSKPSMPSPLGPKASWPSIH